MTAPGADADLIARLSATPERLAAAINGKADAQLRAPLAAGEWSLAEIVAHLRASDDILAYRAYMILAREDCPLPLFDERVWAEVAGYSHLDPRRSLQSFTLRRGELVAMLRLAGPAGMRRTGKHEQRGDTPLSAILATLADHEEEHLAALEAS